MPTTVILKDNEQTMISLQPHSAAGNPVKISSVPGWSTSDPTIVTITPAPDAMSCLVSSVGKLGQASVRCDFSINDRENRGQNVIKIVEVSVEAGEAVDAELAIGPVELKPPAEKPPADAEKAVPLAEPSSPPVEVKSLA